MSIGSIIIKVPRTTSELPEGSNLYWTQARIDAALSGLSSFLPITGGTLTGDLTVSTGKILYVEQIKGLGSAPVLFGSDIELNGKSISDGANADFTSLSVQNLAHPNVGESIIVNSNLDLGENWIYVANIGSNTGSISVDTDMYFNAGVVIGGQSPLLSDNALSDLSDASTARANLGLGSAALQSSSYFALSGHTHTIANVTGLQSALNAKLDAGYGMTMVDGDQHINMNGADVVGFTNLAFGINNTPVISKESDSQLGITGTISVPKIINAPTNNSSSGTDYTVKILPIINQTGTASSTDLLINRTQTATGSGSQKLIDAQVGGTSKFYVDNGGNGYFSNQLSITAAAAALSMQTGVGPYAKMGSAYIRTESGGLFSLNSGGYTISTASYSDVNISANTYTSTSGTNTIVKVSPTYNQASGTAANTDLYINRTETAVGSGTQKFIDCAVAGTSYFYVTSRGKMVLSATNTAGGTTGAQTINKPTGTVNFAAGATSLTVTNSLVTTSSIVFAVVRTNDTTAVIKNVVPSSGSFVINLSAAATAETSVGFVVYN